MKVSVITPVYNNAKTIKRTLEAILAQTHKDVELLVVDDGSTDNSAEIIKGIKDERIRYFKMANSGSPSRPRNLAIKEATGDFIALCDADDIWYPEKLERQLATYQGSKDQGKVGIIATSANLVDEAGKILEKNTLADEYISAQEARARLLKSDFITACSAMVPISVMKEVGEFNEDLRGVDEYDVWLRITKKYDVITVSEPLCAWVMTGTNLSGDKTALYLQDEKIFDRLEAEEDSDAVRIGHLKNLNRILAAAILAKNKEALGLVAEKLSKKSVGVKIKAILWLSRVSLPLARALVLVLKKLGVVNV